MCHSHAASTQVLLQKERLKIMKIDISSKEFAAAK
jgi:hypothetical protein